MKGKLHLIGCDNMHVSENLSITGIKKHINRAETLAKSET